MDLKGQNLFLNSAGLLKISLLVGLEGCLVVFEGLLVVVLELVRELLGLGCGIRELEREMVKMGREVLVEEWYVVIVGVSVVLNETEEVLNILGCVMGLGNVYVFGYVKNGFKIFI